MQQDREALTCSNE